ncbi:MAG TPA: acetylornithine transaminase [Peptococcaceae bacterium]|jgi:acetylornithine/N-succinyldiaminopimelate aminotransferase|nr:acetylornithine transaminase [Clostridia bacterium]HOB82131.1 acetylornithine transaminase [Peptococcaceae bacterium]HQD54012.1 acetylornithine transaminase [Peptococcaceae bacterium]
MDNQILVALGQDYIMNTYSHLAIALVRGFGSYVWDSDGNKYLDLISGIAVNNVGHCHPRVVKAIQEQAEQLIHCSNLYWNQPQTLLAKLLVDNSCGEKVFFCNSGAEANEGAIKLARKYAAKKYGSKRYEIITALDSFHGRTMGALTATGQEKYQQDFKPLVPGFKYVPYNDLQALQDAVTAETCAILLEPVQGEGGVHPATKEYLDGVKALCAKKGLLLIFDEVQTGLGRTGKLFAYEHYGVEPDIFTLAKGLGGGVPIGAIVARGEAATAFEPGDHASTFGGNPLATAAAHAALSVILNENLAQEAAAKGEYIKQQINEFRKNNPLIKEIRGLGLLLGIELNIEGQKVQQLCQRKGVLVNCVQSRVIRLAPPLNISYDDIKAGLKTLQAVFEEIGRKD